MIAGIIAANRSRTPQMVEVTEWHRRNDPDSIKTRKEGLNQALCGTRPTFVFLTVFFTTEAMPISLPASVRLQTLGKRPACSYSSVPGAAASIQAWYGNSSGWELTWSIEPISRP